MSRKRLMLVAALLPFAASQSCADFNLKSWRHYSDIAPATAGDYVQVLIPPAVFDRARPDLADLRVVDDGDRETPYQLIVPQQHERERALTARRFNYGQTKDSVTFTVDVGGRDFHNRLSIETPDSNFRQAVRIEGSDDLRRWVTLKQRGYIFDFSHEYHARSITLSYPESNHRYLKVTVFHGAEKPLDVKGVEVHRLLPPARVETEVSFASLSRTENAKEKTTDLTIDLGFRNVPVHRINVSTSDTNFHRQVNLQCTNNCKDWVWAQGSGVIYRLSTERFHGEQLSLDFPETQSRYLRLRVHNYDDQPLRTLQVRLFGGPRALVFRSEPPRRYRLFCGNAGALPPHYDFAQVFPYLSIREFSQLALASMRTNSAFVERRRPRGPWTEEYPGMLWAVLLVVVASLGLLLWRAFAKIKTAANERSE